MRIEKQAKNQEREAITVQEDFRVGEFLIEKGDRFVVLPEQDKKNDKDEKSSKLDAIMKKVSDGKDLTDAEKKMLATAIDASKKGD